MIYGYLRVSSDAQDVNSQRQGVDSFAHKQAWKIDEYITDEGISGGKDPSKRKLGPLLEKMNEGDVIIASEISRLGRDLYMVMEILHHCMKNGCKVYTVKDNFILGNDIQSKVLAFAFGLAAEIERQMIQQRTKEGLKLRMKMGVLLGRPIDAKSSLDSRKLNPYRDKVMEQIKWGVPLRRVAENFGVNRTTLSDMLLEWGELPDEIRNNRMIKKAEKARMLRSKSMSYKDEPPKIVPLPEDKVIELIEAHNTIPQIADYFPDFTYEQIYDTINYNEEWNALYRKHGQLKLVKRR